MRYLIDSGNGTHELASTTDEELARKLFLELVLIVAGDLMLVEINDHNQRRIIARTSVTNLR